MNIQLQILDMLYMYIYKYIHLYMYICAYVYIYVFTKNRTRRETRETGQLERMSLMTKHIYIMLYSYAFSHILNCELYIILVIYNICYTIKSKKSRSKEKKPPLIHHTYNYIETEKKD